jgi:hypothetical protein
VAEPGLRPTASRLPRDNPFASRHVRPGALPFLFGPGESLAQLVERLAGHSWWGQVVGPHGSGKSTLLAAVLPELERAGRRPLAARLNQQNRIPGEEVWQVAEGAVPRMLVIDGYEQLSWRGRRRLKAACRRNGHGLLVSCHRGLGLPPLYRTAVTVELARRVLDRLLTPGQRQALGKLDLGRALAGCGGNLREVLFDLYDFYEERTRRMEGR